MHLYNHEQVEDDKLIVLRLVKSSWPFYEYKDSLATSQLLSRWYYCNQSPFFLNGLDSSYKYLIKKTKYRYDKYRKDEHDGQKRST